MGFFLISILLSVRSAMAALDGPAPATPASSAAAAPAAPANPWVEPARDVLAQASCGGCHRPGLPTTNPRALKIFNLHDPVWYGTMTDGQLLSLRDRVQGSSKIEEGDRNVVIAFVNCKLAGACAEPPGKESPK